MRTRLLKLVAHLSTSSPCLVVFAFLALTTASTYITLQHLSIHTDQDDLVSEKLAYHKKYKDFLREFGDQEYIYIVVETGNSPTQAKRFVRELSRKLQEDPDIKEVIYQVINPKLEKGVLLFLDIEKLKQIKKFTQSKHTSPLQIAQWRDLSDIFNSLNNELDEIKPIEAEEELTFGFTLLSHMLDGLKNAVTNNTIRPIPFESIFFGLDRTYDEEGFIFSKNGRYLFIMIMPKKDYSTLDVIANPLARIRKTIAATKEKFDGIKVGVTGRPVLQADEMQTTNNDMKKAATIAIAGIIVLFLLSFKTLVHPLMVVVALASGIALTFGLTTITIGYLNLLSIVFAIILIGVGVDFGIHVLARYREEVSRGASIKSAIQTTLVTAGRANFTAAVTTAAAFYAICFTKFKALTELGFIAGSGIILCLSSTLILLPSLIYIYDSSRKRPPRNGVATLPILNATANKASLVVILSLTLTTAALILASKVRFDNNLLNLQAEGLESVEYEKKIIEETDYSTWFSPFIVNSYQEGEALVRRLEASNVIGSTEWIGDVIPQRQTEKIELIKSMAESFKSLHFTPPTEIFDLANLKHQLERLKRHLHQYAELALSSGRYDAVEELDNLISKIETIGSNLSNRTASRISRLQMQYLISLKSKIQLLSTKMQPDPITEADIPNLLLRRYKSPKGRYVVYAYPKENIWDPKKLESFINEIRKIDPDVTGTPVEVYESSKLMLKSFVKAAIMALAAIIVFVFLDFRKPTYVLLAVMPLAVGIIWLLGTMGAFSIPFNLANFFSIPILIGIAVDYGVHMLHRSKHSSAEKAITSSTGTAILLSSLTTALGFGAMMVASHRGIASLGKIMAIGAVSCLIASLFLLPATLKLLNKRRDESKPAPFTTKGDAKD